MLHVKSGGHATPKQVERLIGHLIFVFMLRRPMRSILLCYSYRRLGGPSSSFVWGSMRADMALAQKLFVLKYVDMSLLTGPNVIICVSCLEGFGMVRGHFPPRDVESVVSWIERWPFKIDDCFARRPRDAALDSLGVFGDTRKVRPEPDPDLEGKWCADPRFSKVGRPLTEKASWRHLRLGRWRPEDPIHSGEALPSASRCSFLLPHL